MAYTKTMPTLQVDSLVRAGKPGRYAVSPGLYLQVTAVGTSSWLLRYQLDGRSREMGLGRYKHLEGGKLLGDGKTVPLDEARGKVADAYRLLRDGIDPLQVREQHRAQAKAEAALTMTFDAAAAAYVESHRSGWRLRWSRWR